MNNEQVIYTSVPMNKKYLPHLECGTMNVCMHHHATKYRSESQNFAVTFVAAVIAVYRSDAGEGFNLRFR